MTKCFLCCCASFVLMLSCCDSSNRSSPNKFADTIIVKIADFQDRRMSDSVIQYLRREDVIYRREAALALASIQDSAAVKSLGALMDDPDSTVRKAVVFALGQTPSRLSENLLLEICSIEKSKFVLQDAIEAYGKVSTSWQLTLSDKDAVLTSALAWSYYRAAVRGIADSSMNVKAVEFLKPLYNISTRLGAAHYFARGAKNFESFSNELIALALQDASPHARMAAALALRKVSSDAVLTTCIAICMRDKDARVRVNAVRSLQSFPFQKTKASLLKSLQDSSLNVSIAASEVIKRIHFKRVMDRNPVHCTNDKKLASSS
jgi:HEAT repeat protein